MPATITWDKSRPHLWVGETPEDGLRIVANGGGGSESLAITIYLRA